MSSLKQYPKKNRLLEEVLWGLCPFLAVFFIDRFTKNWAVKLPGAFNLLFVKFELVYNYGIMMGWMTNVPDHVKTTILATTGAVILSSYLVIMAFAPIHSKWLKLGLSVLASGIMGNVTDRLIGFAVVDFISIGSSPYYNLADMFQWIGYLLIVYGVYQDSVEWWPTEDFRNKTLIKPSLQLRAGALLAMMNFLVGFIFIVFGFAFFKDDSNSSFMSYYFLCSLALLSFLTLAGLITGIILSHRVAGPIHAMEKYLNESMQGEDRPFSLRKNDEFKELEDICTRLNSRINRSK